MHSSRTLRVALLASQCFASCVPPYVCVYMLAALCAQVWGLCEAPVPRLTLPVRANVCSIKFSPAAPHMLAAGNAGHQVRLLAHALWACWNMLAWC